MTLIFKKRSFCTIAAVFLFVAIVTSMPLAQSQEFRFEKDIAAYEKKSQETPPPENCTMFVGSSTWRLWGDQLEKDFAEFKAVNRGFGGSKIPEQLHVMHRIIFPHKPARIAFFCGGNDVAGGASAETTFNNFRLFLSWLWLKNPKTEVYFVSITSAPVREKFHDETLKLNQLAKELADKTTGLYYVDTFSTLVGEDGRAKEEYFLKDRLHLNRDGQERWIPVIKKALQDVEKSRTDVSHEAITRNVFNSDCPKTRLKIVKK